MLSEEQLAAGGAIALVLGCLGTGLNLASLAWLLVGGRERNPTGVLLAFLSGSSLVHSAVALPLTGASYLAPSYFQVHCISSQIHTIYPLYMYLHKVFRPAVPGYRLPLFLELRSAPAYPGRPRSGQVGGA